MASNKELIHFLIKFSQEGTTAGAAQELEKLRKAAGQLGADLAAVQKEGKIDFQKLFSGVETVTQFKGKAKAAAVELAKLNVAGTDLAEPVKRLAAHFEQLGAKTGGVDAKQFNALLKQINAADAGKLKEVSTAVDAVGTAAPKIKLTGTEIDHAATATHKLNSLLAVGATKVGELVNRLGQIGESMAGRGGLAAPAALKQIDEIGKELGKFSQLAEQGMAKLAKNVGLLPGQLESVATNTATARGALLELVAAGAHATDHVRGLVGAFSNTATAIHGARESTKQFREELKAAAVQGRDVTSKTDAIALSNAVGATVASIERQRDALRDSRQELLGQRDALAGLTTFQPFFDRQVSQLDKRERLLESVLGKAREEHEVAKLRVEQMQFATVAAKKLQEREDKHVAATQLWEKAVKAIPRDAGFTPEAIQNAGHLTRSLQNSLPIYQELLVKAKRLTDVGSETKIKEAIEATEAQLRSAREEQQKMLHLREQEQAAAGVKGRGPEDVRRKVELDARKEINERLATQQARQKIITQLLNQSRGATDSYTGAALKGYTSLLNILNNTLIAHEKSLATAKEVGSAEAQGKLTAAIAATNQELVRTTQLREELAKRITAEAKRGKESPESKQLVKLEGQRERALLRVEAAYAAAGDAQRGFNTAAIADIRSYAKQLEAAGRRLEDLGARTRGVAGLEEVFRKATDGARDATHTAAEATAQYNRLTQEAQGAAAASKELKQQQTEQGKFDKKLAEFNQLYKSYEEKIKEAGSATDKFHKAAVGQAGTHLTSLERVKRELEAIVAANQTSGRTQLVAGLAPQLQDVVKRGSDARDQVNGLRKAILESEKTEAGSKLGDRFKRLEDRFAGIGGSASRAFDQIKNSSVGFTRRAISDLEKAERGLQSLAGPLAALRRDADRAGDKGLVAGLDQIKTNAATRLAEVTTQLGLARTAKDAFDKQMGDSRFLTQADAALLKGAQATDQFNRALGVATQGSKAFSESAVTGVRSAVNAYQEQVNRLTQASQRAGTEGLKDVVAQLAPKIRDATVELDRMRAVQERLAAQSKTQRPLIELQNVYEQQVRSVHALVGAQHALFKSSGNLTAAGDNLGKFRDIIQTTGKEGIFKLAGELTAMEQVARSAFKELTLGAQRATALGAPQQLINGYHQLQNTLKPVASALEVVGAQARTAKKDYNPLQESVGRLPGSFVEVLEQGSLFNKFLTSYASRLSLGRDGTGQLVAGLKQIEDQFVKTRGQGIDMIFGFQMLGQTMAAPFIAAIKSSAEFSDKMGLVSGVTQATTREFQALTQIALDLGATTRFTAEQAADGLRLLAMAGFNAAQAMSALPTALNLAQAAGLELGKTADVVTNIMTTFQKTAEQLPESADILTRAFTRSNSTLVELGTAFRYVGAIAHGTQADFKDITGALALMHNAGFKGSLAGTALRGSFMRLLNPTKENTRLLEDIGKRLGLVGFQMTDASGRFVGFVRVLEQFEQAGLTSGEALQLFGQRAGPGISALLGQGSAKLKEFTEDLEFASGTAALLSKEMAETLKGRFLLLRSSLEGLGEQFVHNISPALKTVADSLSSLTQGFITFRNAFPAVTAVFDTVAGAAVALMLALGTLAVVWRFMIVPTAQFVGLAKLVTGGFAATTVAAIKASGANTWYTRSLRLMAVSAHTATGANRVLTASLLHGAVVAGGTALVGWRALIAGIGVYIKSVVGAATVTAGITAAIRGLGIALLTVGRFFLLNPIGLTLTAIAAAMYFFGRATSTVNTQLGQQISQYKGMRVQLAGLGKKISDTQRDMLNRQRELNAAGKDFSVDAQFRQLDNQLRRATEGMLEMQKEFGKGIRFDFDTDASGRITRVTADLKELGQTAVLYSKDMRDIGSKENLSGLVAVQKAMQNNALEQQRRDELKLLVNLERQVDKHKKAIEAAEEKQRQATETRDKYAAALERGRVQLRASGTSHVNLAHVARGLADAERDLEKAMNNTTQTAFGQEQAIQALGAQMVEVMSLRGASPEKAEEAIQEVTNRLREQNKDVTLSVGFWDRFAANLRSTVIPVLQDTKKELNLTPERLRIAQGMEDIARSMKAGADQLEEEQGRIKDILAEGFELDSKEMDERLSAFQQVLAREEEAAERSLENRLAAVKRESEGKKDITAETARLTAQAEADRVKAVRASATASLALVDQFMDAREAAFREAGLSLVDIEESAFEQRKDLLDEEVSAVQKAMNKIADQRRNVLDRITKLENGRKKFLKDYAEFERGLQRHTLTPFQKAEAEKRDIQKRATEAREAYARGEYELAQERAQELLSDLKSLQGSTPAWDTDTLAFLTRMGKSVEATYEGSYVASKQAAQKTLKDLDASMHQLSITFTELGTKLERLIGQFTQAIKGEKVFQALGFSLRDATTLTEALEQRVDLLKRAAAGEIDIGISTEQAQQQLDALQSKRTLVEQFQQKVDALRSMAASAAKQPVVDEQQQQVIQRTVQEVVGLREEMLALTGVDVLKDVGDVRTLGESVGSITDKVTGLQRDFGVSGRSVAATLQQIIANADGMDESMVGVTLAMTGAETGFGKLSKKQQEAVKTGQTLSTKLRELRVQQEEQARLEPQVLAFKELDEGAQALLNMVAVIKEGDRVSTHFGNNFGNVTDEIQTKSKDQADAAQTNLLKITSAMLQFEQGAGATETRLRKLVDAGKLDPAVLVSFQKLRGEVENTSWARLATQVQNSGENFKELGDAGETIQKSFRAVLTTFTDVEQGAGAISTGAEELQKKAQEVQLAGTLVEDIEALRQRFLALFEEIRKVREIDFDLGTDIDDAMQRVNDLTTAINKMRLAKEEFNKVPVNANVQGNAGGGVIRLEGKRAGGLIARLAAGGHAVQRFAAGGFNRLRAKVPGAGRGDKVPALLEPGEFVMRRAAVNKFGLNFMHSVNVGALPQLRALGGAISSIPGTLSALAPVGLRTAPLAAPAGGGGGPGLDVYFHVDDGERQPVHTRFNARTELDRLVRAIQTVRTNTVKR